MAKRLRKTLPKHLADLPEASDVGAADAVKAALLGCEPDARGGYGKQTVLMMGGCTEDLARWMLDRGADINATDEFDYTPLHKSAAARFFHHLTPAFLLDHGANLGARTYDGLTPLHVAVDGKHLAAVEVLLARGAEVDALSKRDLTPLEHGLARMSNVDLVAMVPVARLMLERGARVTTAPELVLEAAKRFEFHRAGFAADLVEATSAASAALCAMFGVAAPAPRTMHDGAAPIVISASRWQDQHEELWQRLVPSSGPSQTVQGEVIRISGRVSDELHRNGGGNWDADYQRMLDAFLLHVASGVPLAPGELAELRELATLGRAMSIEKGQGTARLAQLAVAWVMRNPTPVGLPSPAYRR